MKNLLIIFFLLLSINLFGQKKEHIYWSYLGDLHQTNRLKPKEVEIIDPYVFVYGNTRNWDQFWIFHLENLTIRIRAIKIHSREKYHGNLKYVVVRDSVVYLPMGPYTKKTAVFSLNDTLQYPQIVEDVFPFILSKRERSYYKKEVEKPPLRFHIKNKVIVSMIKSYYDSIYQKYDTTYQNLSPTILKHKIMEGSW